MRILGTSLGPITTNVNDIKLILENTFGEFHSIDFYCNKTKFNQNVYSDIIHGRRKLRVAVIKSDEFFEAAPVMQNVVDEVTQRLKDKGHDIIMDFGIKDFR